MGVISARKKVRCLTFSSRLNYAPFFFNASVIKDQLLSVCMSHCLVVLCLIVTAHLWSVCANALEKLVCRKLRIIVKRLYNEPRE